MRPGVVPAPPLPFGPWWEAFRRLVERDDDDVVVVPAALAAGHILQGGVTWPGADKRLAALEAQAAAAALDQRPPDEAAPALLELLAAEGFVGDREHYEDPTNSFLDRVLERRRGLPIALSVLAVHLARHAGIDLHGVGLPGHFVVGTNLDHSTPLLLDPFHGGKPLGPATIAEIIGRATGVQTSPGDPRWLHYLRPAAGRDIVQRMLRNLVMHFKQAQATSHAEAAQKLLVLVSPRSETTSS